MFKYIYNYFNNNYKPITKYPELEEVNDNIDNKQLRINILLFIRQYKNAYYKYTNKNKFNEELYDLFVNDENFDDKITAYDDEDENIRIFDKYIFEYIKDRDDIMRYLQSNNKIVNLKSNLEEFNDIIFSKNNIDILFILDMSEKDIFTYCYNLLHNHQEISYIKDILFSIIFKYDNQIIRLKVDSLKTIQSLIHI